MQMLKMHEFQAISFSCISFDMSICFGKPVGSNGNKYFYSILKCVSSRKIKGHNYDIYIYAYSRIFLPEQSKIIIPFGYIKQNI